MKNLDDYSPEEQQHLERQVLDRIVTQAEREPLTIADIRRMSPEQILADKDRVDRFMATWGGSEPEAEGQSEGTERPEPTALEKYRTELAALPQSEREQRANADFESGKFAKIARGEAA